MGYCQPYWVSDYTYTAFFNREKIVNNGNVIPPEALNRTYPRARVGAGGKLSWMEPLSLRLPPSGEVKNVTFTSDAGSETLAGQYYPYDHLEGGVLFLPEPSHAYDGIQIEIAGQLVSLGR